MGKFSHPPREKLLKPKTDHTQFCTITSWAPKTPVVNGMELVVIPITNGYMGFTGVIYIYHPYKVELYNTKKTGGPLSLHLSNLFCWGPTVRKLQQRREAFFPPSAGPGREFSSDNESGLLSRCESEKSFARWWFQIFF